MKHLTIQQRLLHLRLWEDPDGRGCREDAAGNPEAHREPGLGHRPAEVRQHEEKPQISGGYLWINKENALFIDIYYTSCTLNDIGILSIFHAYGCKIHFPFKPISISFVEASHPSNHTKMRI